MLDHCFGIVVLLLLASSASAGRKQKIVLGGLFPVHYKSAQLNSDLRPCGRIQERRGIQRMEAMLWAVDEVNRQRKLLPTIELSTNVRDTCGDAIYALNQSLVFVRDLMGAMDGDSYRCPSGERPVATAQRAPVAGVIGEAYSDVTIQTANLLKLFQLVQISPASTAVQLSDKQKYSYFARTVPADIHQAKALADVAHRFNWTYVSLVYSADEYGESGAEEFKKACKHLGICIAFEAKISNIDSIADLAANLRENSEKEKGMGARVVVLFTRNDDTRLVLQAIAAAKRESVSYPNLVWLAAEGWEMSPQTTAGAEDVALGAMLTSLSSERVPRFEAYFRALHPHNYTREQRERNPWFFEFWQEKFDCSLAFMGVNTTGYSGKPACDLRHQSLTTETELMDDKIEFVVDAVNALAHALHKMWYNLCKPKFLPRRTKGRKMLANESRRSCDSMNTSRPLFGPQLYRDYLMKVKFKGITNKTFTFDSKGDGPPAYRILNFQRNIETLEHDYVVVGSWKPAKLDLHSEKIWWSTPNHKPPISRCSADCERGSVRKLQADNCCWVCFTCKPNEYQKDDYTCEACPHGDWPLENKTACFNLAATQLEFMLWSDAYSVIPAILSAIGIVLALAVIVIFLLYNETPVVKASGRELTYLLLIGLLICYSMTYVVLARPSAWTCGVKRIGIGVGFTLIYASLLVKTNRIFRIFDSARHGATRPKFISPISQVVITVMLVGAQMLASIVWLALSPPETKFDYPEPQPRVVLKCKVDEHYFLISLSYDMLLVVVCTVYAVKTRMVPENFNETKFIGFTMYTTCIIWLAFVPIYFGTGNNFQIQTTTLCVSISLSATVALVCLYSPKLWIIFMEPEKNQTKYSAGNKGRAAAQFKLSKPTSDQGGLMTTQSTALSQHHTVYSPLVPKQNGVLSVGPIESDSTSINVAAVDCNKLLQVRNNNENVNSSNASSVTKSSSKQSLNLDDSVTSL